MREAALNIDREGFICLVKKVRAKKLFIDALLKNTIEIQSRWSKISRELRNKNSLQK